MGCSGSIGFRLIVTFKFDDEGMLSDDDCKLFGNFCAAGSSEPRTCRRIVRGIRVD